MCVNPIIIYELYRLYIGYENVFQWYSMVVGLGARLSPLFPMGLYIY